MVVKPISQKVCTTMTAVPIENREIAYFLAWSLNVWRLEVQNNRDSVLVELPVHPAMSVRSIV